MVVDSVVEGGCEFAGVRVHPRSMAMRVVNGWIGNLAVGVGVLIRKMPRPHTGGFEEWKRLRAALMNEQVG